MLDVPTLRDALKADKDYPLRIRMNNAFMYNERDHLILWDDPHEQFFVLSYNPNPQSAAHGLPISIAVTPYDLIEALELFITNDTEVLEGILDKINEIRPLTAEERKRWINNPIKLTEGKFEWV